MSMSQVLPIDGRNNALVPVQLVPVDMNTIQLGQPNFMGWAARIIRNGEAGGTIAKISTYVLSRLLAAIVSLIPGLGIYLVGKTIIEYARQNNEVAIHTNPEMRQLNAQAVQANQNMAAQQQTIAANQATITELQGQLGTAQEQNLALTQRVTTWKETGEQTTARLERELKAANGEIDSLREQNDDLQARLKPATSGSPFNLASLTSPIKTA
ncbi:MAG: hypothetical protein ACHQT8_01065 [Chlamydiales bacterium]